MFNLNLWKKKGSLDHECARSLVDALLNGDGPQVAHVAIQDGEGSTFLLLGLEWNESWCKVEVVAPNTLSSKHSIRRTDCLHIKIHGATRA